MKVLKKLLAVIIVLCLAALAVSAAAKITVKNYILNDLHGKLLFDSGYKPALYDELNKPDSNGQVHTVGYVAKLGIYLYDFDTQKTEQQTVYRYEYAGHITGYSRGGFYCSARWLAEDQKFYVLKVENQKVTARIPVESEPAAVIKYRDSALYVLNGDVYLADFQKQTGTIQIKNVSETGSKPLIIRGDTVLFARAQGDSSDQTWYIYKDGKEKLICNAPYVFGFVSDSEMLVRDTDSKMAKINIKTGDKEILRKTAYETPAAVSPDGKYLLCRYTIDGVSAPYLVNLKTGIRLALAGNGFECPGGINTVEWVE